MLSFFFREAWSANLSLTDPGIGNLVHLCIAGGGVVIGETAVGVWGNGQITVQNMLFFFHLCCC